MTLHSFQKQVYVGKKSLKIRMIHIEIQKSKLKTPIFQFGLIFEEWKKKGRKTKNKQKYRFCIPGHRYIYKNIS